MTMRLPDLPGAYLPPKMASTFVQVSDQSTFCCLPFGGTILATVFLRSTTFTSSPPATRRRMSRNRVWACRTLTIFMRLTLPPLATTGKQRLATGIRAWRPPRDSTAQNILQDLAREAIDRYSGPGRRARAGDMDCGGRENRDQGIAPHHARRTGLRQADARPPQNPGRAPTQAIGHPKCHQHAASPGGWAGISARVAVINSGHHPFRHF